MTYGRERRWLKSLRSVLFAGVVLALGCLDLHWLLSLNALGGRTGLWFWVYTLKAAIELLASVYAVFYLLVALSYRPKHDESGTLVAGASSGNTCVVYLCCDDFDLEAVDSIALFCVLTGCSFLIHDDSSSEYIRRRVDDAVARFRADCRLEVQLLRNHHPKGGKPGAVNHAVQALKPSVDYLLLCDSDSHLLLGAAAFQKAFLMFADPAVAIVQFRNCGYTSGDDSLGYRTLSGSVDYYDAFVDFMDRFGWSPFLGHNAILRLSALRQVGGFTPGQLADDIDLSVRLRLAGFTIRYAAFASAGERHPTSYEALRRRTAKWSYGCTQILLRWGASVLLSRRLTAAEKVTFLLTVSYYHFQALLLVYLATFYVVLPLDSIFGAALGPLLVSASLILFFTFLPSITYFSRNGNLLSWPSAATRWGLTYGSQDLLVAMSIARCVFHHKLKWVPTNAPISSEKQSLFLQEVYLGAAIVVAAAVTRPALLLLPTTALFAGKFLISPWLNSLIFQPHIASSTAAESEVVE